MIKAVLLDLDDTLLGNPMESFLEGYFGALDAHLSEKLGLQGIRRLLMLATRDVLYKHDPVRTNWDTFYAALTPHLPVERTAFDEAVSEFYRTAFPGLQRYVTARAAARPLVEWLLDRGYAVVVATNPFFPRVAVEQRLAWADLPVEEIPFALVTTLENMHYSKPYPHYYEEILARVGVHTDEALMVGDDWKNDIVPARQAGMNTFWIGEGAPPPDSDGTVRPDDSGTLDDFARLVRDQGWLDTLTPRPLEPAQIVPRLTGNLAGLLGIASEVPPHVWHMRPVWGEWTPVEVLCHLNDSEREVQRPHLETICREENPFLSQPNLPPGPAARACRENGWQLALAFADERNKTLAFLEGLDETLWPRPARHSIFGPTTLLEMADFTAQHDRLHFTQLCQTVGKCL